MAMEHQTNPPSETPELLLQVRDLHTSFSVEGQTARAVDGVDFDVYAGEVLGLVGESGCGKSVTSLSLLKLIPDPPGCIEKGSGYPRFQNYVAIRVPFGLTPIKLECSG